MKTLKELNKEFTKLSKYFFKVEKEYELTEDIKLYHLLDELNDKKTILSVQIEELESNQ